MDTLYKNKYQQTINALDIHNKTLKENKKDFDNLETTINNYLTALEVLYILRTSKINEKRDKILTMINIGCKDIFEKNYELKIVTTDEIEESSLKEIKYHIILYKNDIEIARNEKLLQASGGGVLSVISVLIKIIINIIYNKDRFFIFDEAMAKVSEQYQTRLSSFIKKLCEKQEITFVLITHMKKLADSADYTYNFKGDFDKNNIPILVLEDEIIVKDYPQYHLHIKNFQSIIDLNIVFSRFTVIQGANDIGKSAIVRAVNSLLSNSFLDTYIRFNKNRNDRCSVHFKKYISEKDLAFDIKMTKEPTGIVYNINGNELRGKALAKDSIADQLNNFGYGNILNDNSLTEFSHKKRNKFGNITITNENDQLYLFDNSSVDNNKIISYIFQATTINNGIIKVKDKIKEFKKDKKYINDNIKKISDIISLKEKEKNIVYLQYLFETSPHLN